VSAPGTSLSPVPSLAELLEDRGMLLADGATATNFQDMGIEPGVAPEEWVFDAPQQRGPFSTAHLTHGNTRIAKT
jgi:hypothetical protein